MPADCSLASAASYEFHRNHEDQGPHLSAPERAIGSDTWVIPLSRRFNRRDGSFAGILVAPGPLLQAARDAGCDFFYCAGDINDLARTWKGVLAGL